MGMKRVIGGVVAIVIVAVAVWFFVKPDSRKGVAIATVGPITGQYASFGEQMKRGLEMAVSDLNAAGGVLGQKIQGIVEDDACDPKPAVAAANKAARSGVKQIGRAASRERGCQYGWN